MIDWATSSVSPESAKNRDKITVVCELCRRPRLQLYVVAKRKLTHHCLSCAKSKGGPHKTGELVEYKCVDCPTTQTQLYRRDRFEGWRCHHCAMVQGHQEGKFKIIYNVPSEAGRERLAELAKERWLDPEYRKKWAATRASTKAARSEASKKLWADQDRLQQLSASLKCLWQSEDYRRNQRAGYTAEVKEVMAAKRAAQPSVSSIQIQLYTYLDDLGVTYFKEGPRTAVGHYVFDCLVPATDDRKHLLIECQGDYWHSLPRSRNNDRRKFTYVDRYFPDHEIMYLWEHEFYAKDRVLDRLKLKLGVVIPTVDFTFSDLRTGEAAAADVRRFLSAYHYIGRDRGGRAFGAWHGSELVGCVVFSNPVRQDVKADVELSRLCIHPSYHKKNFASWLVSRALRGLSGRVVAYADRTVGHQGTVYKACGFRLDHVVPADYWYVDADGFVMHKKTLYGRAIRMGMKEAEFAAAKGYAKKWGGDKLCFMKVTGHAVRASA